MPNIFAIISHLGVIVSFISSWKAYIEKAAKDKQLPVGSAPETKAIFESLRAVLDAGIIVIPGVDDAAISNAVKMIEDKVCA